MGIIKKILVGLMAVVLVLAIAGWWLLRGEPAEYSVEEVTGTDPVLAEPDPQTIPTVQIARPVGWEDGAAPVAADGLVVGRFAEGIEHPRVIYALPNGDILVAQSNAPERILGGGNWFTNMIAGFLFRQAGADVPSPDQVMLLRDEDRDGVAELKTVLRAGLASPSGLAYADGKLYIANHDAVLAFDYQLGATELTGEPTKLMDLPPAGNHWMRNIVLSPDGTKLYVAVGSASNIGEGGMAIEEGRAMIHELDLASGSSRPFAMGLRNPNGLAWSPWTEELWTTVNERDQLGSDLVPDYLTDVPIGAQYGWPWLYWGKEVDERVEAGMPPGIIDYTRKPQFAMGPHVAALGLAFTGAGNRMGEKFAQGAFVARHGSWNRKPAAGYDLVFVNFDERGNPIGKPVPVLTGFLNENGTTKGRPTWVAWDQTGALLLSDDTGNIIWRVEAPGAEPSAGHQRVVSEPLAPRQRITDPFNTPAG
ncbi:MAG TPA: PQQ-dependent sugar dehydrogenase [Sphingomonadaceae bacterium]|nr:PQQ-dependent sugar dehydrogenase [Sphingomonadaceae bacterium]